MNARRSTKRLWRSLAAIGCLGLLGLDNGTRVPRAHPSRVTVANEEAKVKRINQQLDEILAVQEAILKRYDELMEELRIVKIRATQ